MFNQQTNSGDHYFVIPLAVQNHTGLTLAINLQELLSVSFPTFGFTVNYASSKGNITITSTSNELFRILTDRELRDIPSSTSFTDNFGRITQINQSDLQSANSILRHNNTSALSVSFTTQFIDLLNTHSIFIHSPNIGSFETLGVLGESTFIKKSTSDKQFRLFNCGFSCRST